MIEISAIRVAMMDTGRFGVENKRFRLVTYMLFRERVGFLILKTVKARMRVVRPRAARAVMQEPMMQGQLQECCGGGCSGAGGGGSFGVVVSSEMLTVKSLSSTFSSIVCLLIWRRLTGEILVE